MIKNDIFKPCGCGMNLLHGEDPYATIDTIYPVNRERTIINAYCNVSMGGCGRIVYARNIDMLRERWNNDVTDTNVDDSGSITVKSILESLEHYDLNFKLNPEITLKLPLFASKKNN